MEILEIVRALAQGGAPIEQASELVRTLGNANGSVTDVGWALKETEAIYAAKGRRGVTAEVRVWVDASSGWFTNQDLDRDLQITTAQEKGARRLVLHRLVKDKILERNKSKDGVFRRVENTIEIIDWQHADMRELDLRWPFGLEEWEITYPGTLDVIAGAGGAGKSAFLLNFVYLNQANHMIRYISSEMSPQSMRHRLAKFNIGVEDWNFEPIRCSSNFADKILPDSVNVIDYLELDGDNPSHVVNELRDIFDALKTGFVLIGLQKKQNEERFSASGKRYSIKYRLGRGGELSKEKSRLYLVLDFNELYIEKATHRRDDNAPPLKGRCWEFDLYKGCIFNGIEEKFGRGNDNVCT